MAQTKTFQVRAPNGKVYSITGPANATGAQLQAAILKAHPEAKGTGRVPMKGAAGKVETAGMGLTRGIDETIFGTVRLLGQGFELLGAKDTGRAMQGYAKRELDKSTAAYEPFLRENPKTAEGGRIGGNIIGLVAPGKAVAAPLNVLAKAAPKVAPVVQALTSGGMSTGVVTTRAAAKEAPLIAKAVDAALRIGGGAAGGVASSAVLGQDMEEGGAVGAAVSMIPLVGRYGLAPVWDTLRGRVGDARAARIFREALGANYDAARKAFTDASKTSKRTASQILARMGLDADQFFATGEVVARQGNSAGILDDIARGQQTAQRQTLNAAAGGGTSTASRDAAAAQRRVTADTATPIMRDTLETVNTNTRNINTLGREARSARGVASKETKTAKRLLGASDEQAMRLNQMDDLGDPLNMGSINRQRGVVGALEERGSQAAERGLEAGAMARTAEERLANLQDAGVEALDATALSTQFRQLGAKERANPERAALFTGFADEVDRLAAENGGILDAFDLYEIRKDIGDFVQRALSGRATPEGMRKRTAEVISAANPMIDEAFKKAGGDRWAEYLNTFSAGKDEARRIDFADYARKLYEKSPEDFQRLMAGERPEIVERFFGKGRYDVNKQLGTKQLNPQGPPTRAGGVLTATPEGPSRVAAMQNVAAEVADDVRIKNAMTPGGVARAEKAVEPSPNLMVRIGQALPFQLGGVVEAPARMFDEFRNARTVQSMEQGFASPDAASRLMDYRPTGENIFRGLDALPLDVQRTLQQFGVQIGREEPNYMTTIR
jgi:hypothetical protein